MDTGIATLCYSLYYSAGYSAGPSNDVVASVGNGTDTTGTYSVGPNGSV